MSDREKVISTLEEIKTQTAGIGLDSAVISHKFIDKIIALLKEQEAVEPICQIIFDVPYYFCGNCKTMLNMYATKAKYCSKCGKAVKWE